MGTATRKITHRFIVGEEELDVGQAAVDYNGSHTDGHFIGILVVGEQPVKMAQIDVGVETARRVTATSAVIVQDPL